MNKRELLDRAAATAEERMTLARVLDKYEQCQRGRFVTHTDFLTPQEQSAAEDILRSLGEREVFFFGGYEGAERKALFFLPEWMEELPEELPFAFLRASFYTANALSHRDFLGSLMGLGLTREKIGDILVTEKSADIVVMESVADFLCANFTSAGRTALKVEPITAKVLHIPQAKVRRIRATVMSLRLDSIAAEGFGMSRSKAADLINSGKVQLNHRISQRTDAAVEEGSVISARGLGKFTVTKIEGVSKKGRTFVELERYL